MNNKNFYLFLFFIFLILLYHSGKWGVLETSEARYAEIGRELFYSHNIFRPTLLEIGHYHKPPLTYLITAIGILIFGVNSFAIRFFLAVSLIIQLILVYKISLILFSDEKKAFISSIVYFSLPLVLISTRNLTTDNYLNTFILCSIFFMIRYFQSYKTKYLYLYALSLSFGFLTKGPLVFIFPFILWFPLKKYYNFKTHMSIHTLINFTIFVFLGLSWYLYLIFSDKTFLDYFIIHHIVHRFENAKEFSRTEPWWYFILILPVITLPWIIAILTKIKIIYKNKLTSILLFYWIIIPLIFFSLSSSKRPLYILPIMPGFAIIFGEIYSKRSKYFIYYLILLSALSFSSLFLIHKYSFSLYLYLLTIFTLIIFILSIFIKMENKTIFFSTIFSVYLLLFSADFLYLNELFLNGTKPIAIQIKKLGLKNHKILVYNKLLPSLSFNLNKMIYSINDGSKSLKREIQFEKDKGWKKYLIDIKKDKKYLNSILSSNCILIVKKHIKKRSEWIKNYFRKKVKIGKWILYFN